MIQYIRMLLPGATIIAVFMLPYPSNLEAQEPTGPVTGTRAVVIEREPPAYPALDLRGYQEGWVEISYVIKADGTVKDILAGDSFGPGSLRRAAMRAAEKWTFEPATWEGRPVEQCDNRVRVLFDIEEFEDEGADPRFIRDYRSIMRLIDKDQLDKAEKRIESMMTKGNLSLYESPYLNMLLGSIAGKREQRKQHLLYLNRALIGHLEQDTRFGILQTIFMLQVHFKQYAEALRTHADLRSNEGYREGTLDPIDRLAAEIESARAGDQIFTTPAEIEGEPGEVTPFWEHLPLRRQIGFTGISGTIGTFELRCDRKRFVDQVSEEKEWAIPDSWGECRIFVFGNAGAGFHLLEFPDTT